MSVEKTYKQQVAGTILNQIGWRKLYSLRAKNFVLPASATGVWFNVVTRNGTKINQVKVKLTSMDDYTVEFWNINRQSYTAKMVSEFEGVYCDGLGELIMSETKVEELTILPE